MITKTHTGRITKSPDGTTEAVVSTEDIDRDGDRILASGWDLRAFRSNPVVLAGHQYDKPPVGQALKIGVQDRQLVATVRWAPTAEGQTFKALYDGRFLRAFSVGFIPLAEPKQLSRGLEFGSVELLEFSAVSVPSNTFALARSKGIRIPDSLGACRGMAELPERGIEVIAAPNHPTRHGEQVDRYELGQFKRRPVILANHDHSRVVGRAIQVHQCELGLHATLQFAKTPYACQLYGRAARGDWLSFSPCTINRTHGGQVEGLLEEISVLDGKSPGRFGTKVLGVNNEAFKKVDNVYSRVSGSRETDEQAWNRLVGMDSKQWEETLTEGGLAWLK